MDTPSKAIAEWVAYNKVVGWLSADEQEEYQRLLRREDPASCRRREALHRQALHARAQAEAARSPENDLVLYAEVIGQRMRARGACDSSRRGPTPQ